MRIYSVVALDTGKVHRWSRNWISSSNASCCECCKRGGRIFKLTVQYINEQAPAAVRGFLLVAYSMWFTFGGLMASIGLKAQADTHPLNWKTPVYTQFAMIGVSIIIFVFLPESPCEWDAPTDL